MPNSPVILETTVDRSVPHDMPVPAEMLTPLGCYRPGVNVKPTDETLRLKIGYEW